MIQVDTLKDKSFLEEEIRSGYLVTKTRKEIWAIEIDLLVKFDNICRKHGLRYCVGAGTMLGAIRHKGFIPWDDDIDVYMPRSDYDKLMMLENEFRSPYFLQTSFSEKNMLRAYARLRNSLTTGASKPELHRPINKGLFIDISPLDGVSENEKLNKLQYKKFQNFKRIFVLYNRTREIKRGDSVFAKLRYGLEKTTANILVGNKEKYFNAFEKNLKKYSNEATNLWGNRTLTFDCPKTRRPVEDYLDVIYMPFEYIQVPVPKNYDVLLRQQYGDYMKIPENKKGNMHGDLIISTDFAYDDPRRISKQ